ARLISGIPQGRVLRFAILMCTSVAMSFLTSRAWADEQDIPVIAPETDQPATDSSREETGDDVAAIQGPGDDRPGNARRDADRPTRPGYGGPPWHRRGDGRGPDGFGSGRRPSDDRPSRFAEPRGPSREDRDDGWRGPGHRRSHEFARPDYR